MQTPIGQFSPVAMFFQSIHNIMHLLSMADKGLQLILLIH